METVTISNESYEALLKDSQFLSCLKGAGVDNWDGYEIALDIYQSEYQNG